MRPVKNIVMEKVSMLLVMKSFIESFMVLIMLTSSSSLSAQGVGCRRNMVRMPAPATAVSIAPRVIQVVSLMISWSWKRKKEIRFPMMLEDMFMAQNIPEFRVMVSSSEFRARKVP